MSKTYLVGGAVRDMLLNRPVKDRDWVVVGATPQEMLDAGFTQVGADFPVFLHPTTKEEYALARTERKTGKGYHGFETDYSTDVTLEDDLRRRDLTVNAMAIEDKDVMDFKMTGDAALLVDPFNGATYLEAGVLRHVSDAFAEDPVRVLRVARFAARYDFTVHPTTVGMMCDMAVDGELDHLVPERTWAEFEKAITEPHPHLYFRTLSECGALEKVHPFFGVAQYPQVLDVCDEFTCEMAARHRAAAVLVLCMVHMGAHRDEHKRVVQYERNRVPNNVRKLVEQFLFLTTRETDAYKPGTARDWLHRLKHVNWYRDPVMLDEVRRLLPPYMFFEPRFKQLEAAFYATEDVAYANLSDEQKATLKGEAVGEAIDELRLEKLRKLEFTEKLRG